MWMRFCWGGFKQLIFLMEWLIQVSKEKRRLWTEKQNVNEQNNLEGKKQASKRKSPTKGADWRSKGGQIILETVVTDGTKGLRLPRDWERWTKSDTDTSIIKLSFLSHQLCLSQGAPPPPSSTHWHTNAKTNTSDLSGWEWVNPKGTRVIVPGPRQRNTSASAPSPCWWWRREIQEKVIEGPVTLMWAVAGEPSRRWNFACFNLTDRHYKLLPEEGHFMVPLVCKRQKKRKMKEEERKTGEEKSWHSSPGENQSIKESQRCFLHALVH